jgi:hypothetical protein
VHSSAGNAIIALGEIDLEEGNWGLGLSVVALTIVGRSVEKKRHSLKNRGLTRQSSLVFNQLPPSRLNLSLAGAVHAGFMVAQVEQLGWAFVARRLVIS